MRAPAPEIREDRTANCGLVAFAHEAARTSLYVATSPFLATGEGEEIDFHRHAVLEHALDRLKLGSDVTFVEEMGDEGAQASTVALRRE